MSKVRQLLLVDDETNVLNALVRALRQQRPAGEMRIEAFTNPFEALQRCCEVDFDVVISDFRMPEMTGVEFLFNLKEIAPATVRMILSASTEFENVSSAISNAKVFRYIPKPWQIEDLQHNIDLALAERDALLEAERLAREERARAAQQEDPQAREARLLEEESPGLTQVKWGPNGEIIL